jgi:hypothetical protein
MRISDIQGIEGMTCLQEEYEDVSVKGGYTSDLLSDVMAHAEEGSVLITIQAHKNTVAVSSLAGVVGIIVCNNRPVEETMIDAALQEGIAIFQTKENQFQATCRIAQRFSGCPAR